MKEYTRVNQAAYDILAHEYDKRAEVKSNYEETADTLGGAVIKHAQKTPDNLSVLEVGPGSGEIISFFEQLGCRTIAVELSEKIAEIAKARSPNTFYILGDILEVKFQSNQFDIIYAGALIHLFPLQDALILLSNFMQWLKPNGVLFINTTVHSSSEEGYFMKIDYGTMVKRFRRKWTEEEFLEVLKDTGFEILERLFTNEVDRQKIWVAFLCRKKG